MAQITAIQGVAEVVRNLRRQEQAMAQNVSRGLRRAGLFLQRESMLRVPVDFSALKNSAYTRRTGNGWRTKVTVGYTAPYAIYVHENVEMKLKGQPRRPPSKGRYWDPQGRAQAKFLEEPMRTLAPRIRDIIRNEGRVQ